MASIVIFATEPADVVKGVFKVVHLNSPYQGGALWRWIPWACAQCIWMVPSWWAGAGMLVHVIMYQHDPYNGIRVHVIMYQYVPFLFFLTYPYI